MPSAPKSAVPMDMYSRESSEISVHGMSRRGCLQYGGGGKTTGTCELVPGTTDRAQCTCAPHFQEPTCETCQGNFSAAVAKTAFRAIQDHHALRVPACTRALHAVAMANVMEMEQQKEMESVSVILLGKALHRAQTAP